MKRKLAIRIGLMVVLAGAWFGQGCVSTSHKLVPASLEKIPMGWSGFGGQESRRPAQSDMGATADASKRYPWEVYGAHGETLLPNIYYSELSENQQVMPLMIRNGYVIDRMIYPTIGHPHLVVKNDPTDKLTVVLRVEGATYAHLKPVVTPGSDPFVSDLTLTQKEGADEMAFFLVKKSRRRPPQNENPNASFTESDDMPFLAFGDTAYRIHPQRILVDSKPASMPAAFKTRDTLRVSFDVSDLAKIPRGLYDIRFQVIKAGRLVEAVKNDQVYDYQYNAVAIYEKVAQPSGDGFSFNENSYQVMNVTDSQVSGGAKYTEYTGAKLREFRDYINREGGVVKAASFITFNGDLHNGGAPGGLFSRYVATTYNAEAREIWDTLRELNKPIFLTAGNHDGYAGTTAVPSGIQKGESSIGRVSGVFESAIGYFSRGTESDVDRDLVDEYNSSEVVGRAHIPLPDVVQKYALDTKQSNWPGLNSTDQLVAEQEKVADQPGGKHVNIFEGSHIRTVPTIMSGNWLEDAWKTSWRPVDIRDRNMILFDGFYQWQKTYGPLYYSWNFGKNHYISLNSFDLRQHRRTGWGMYTVNYGGWVSPVQFDWLRRDLNQSQNMDIILLAHHDPRGGHNGKDFPYYFKQIEFSGMDESASNYVWGSIINKRVCSLIPDVAEQVSSDPTAQRLTCMHDGLQEWMRPDPEFDCDPSLVKPNDPQLGCDLSRIRNAAGLTPWYSGYDMISLLSGTNGKVYSNLRTVLLGHTHYNSMEIIQSGDKLVPDTVQLDDNSQKERAGYEVLNPLRAVTMAKEATKGGSQASVPTGASDGGRVRVLPDYMTKNQDGVQLNVKQYYPSFQNVLQGNGRELAVLRMTAVSKLTSQVFNDQGPMYGFSIFNVMTQADKRNYTLPQMNGIYYFINSDQSDGRFSLVNAGKPVAIPRSLRVLNPATSPDQIKKDNPVIKAGMHM